MNFFVPKEYVSENQIVIKGSDVNHIKNVLRHSIGDVLDIVSDNIKYSAKIIEINSDFVRCEIEEVHKEECANIKITVFQGLAKADKIEYIIQKCTELGVYEIAPVEMKRCVIKLDENDKMIPICEQAMTSLTKKDENDNIIGKDINISDLELSNNDSEKCSGTINVKIDESTYKATITFGNDVTCE